MKPSFAFPSLAMLVATLCACSHRTAQTPRIFFSPPPGFTAAAAPPGARYAWQKPATREQIVQWAAYINPPARVRAGQKITSFIMCTDVRAVAWEYPARRPGITQLDLFEQWSGGGGVVFIYTRPSRSAASRQVMYSLTTSCPTRAM